MKFPQVRTFEFNLQVESELSMPPYKGALLRGALGAALRKNVCSKNSKNRCDTCSDRRSCVYANIFEPQPPKHFPDAAKFLSATAPYVLNPPSTTREVIRAGESLSFELVLIGKAVDALPFFVFSAIELGKHGLGRKRAKFVLGDVSEKAGEQSRIIFDGNKEQFVDRLETNNPALIESNGRYTGKIRKISLHFHTPLRLKSKGKLISDFSFPTFFNALCRRLDLLAAFYGEGVGFEIPLFLRESVQEIQLSENFMSWCDWKRFCRRQNYTMKLGGLKGRVNLNGELTGFMPYLSLASKVNMGHGTSFGLGKFSICHLNEEV